MLGSLQTFEQKFQPSKKKSVALKVEEHNQEKEFDEEFYLVAKKFKKFFGMNAKDFRKKQLPKNSSQNFRRIDKPKEEPQYYECKGFGHLVVECTNKKMKAKNKAMATLRTIVMTQMLSHQLVKKNHHMLLDLLCPSLRNYLIKRMVPTVKIKVLKTFKKILRCSP